jgi:hypothetical protein
MESHWFYKGEILNDPPENIHGFVYIILNKINDKKYIGRKYFNSIRRVKKKGTNRRKVTRKESDWKQYVGSSKNLISDINEYGKDNFSFHIIALGETKGQVNYLEENLQHKFDVLTAHDKDGKKEFYNDSIGNRKFISVKIDENFIKSIKLI